MPTRPRSPLPPKVAPGPARDPGALVRHSGAVPPGAASPQGPPGRGRDIAQSDGRGGEAVSHPSSAFSLHAEAPPPPAGPHLHPTCLRPPPHSRPTLPAPQAAAPPPLAAPRPLSLLSNSQSHQAGHERSLLVGTLSPGPPAEKPILMAPGVDRAPAAYAVGVGGPSSGRPRPTRHP